MPSTITLFIMARDEERALRRCIESAARFVDEVVVLDTGSTDNTVSIAKASGAVVMNTAWNDDFAAARNFGLSRITTDYVLSLDADEWLVQGGEELLKIRTLDFRSAVFEIGMYMSPQVVDDTSRNDVDGVFYAPRIFPSSLRYRGRVHEALVHSLPITRTALRVKHDGYEPAQRERKTGRNLALLEKSLEEEPSNPLTYYYYAKEIRLKLEATKSTLSPDDLSVITKFFKASLQGLHSNSENRELITREALLFFRDYKLDVDGIQLIFSALMEKTLSRELSYLAAVFLYEQVLTGTEIQHKLLLDAADGLFFRVLKEADDVSATYPYELDIALLKNIRISAISVARDSCGK